MVLNGLRRYRFTILDTNLLSLNWILCLPSDPLLWIVRDNRHESSTQGEKGRDLASGSRKETKRKPSTLVNYKTLWTDPRRESVLQSDSVWVRQGTLDLDLTPHLQRPIRSFFSLGVRPTTYGCEGLTYLYQGQDRTVTGTDIKEPPTKRGRGRVLPETYSLGHVSSNRFPEVSWVF